MPRVLRGRRRHLLLAQTFDLGQSLQAEAQVGWLVALPGLGAQDRAVGLQQKR